MSIQKHFIRFVSPGTFVHEETEKEIDSWDVEKAKEMCKNIIERHNSHPFAFQFITKGRGENEFDSRVIAESGFYYINGIVKTLQEIENEQKPENETLLWNMCVNNWYRIVETRTPWKWTSVFNENDQIVII